MKAALVLIAGVGLLAAMLVLWLVFAGPQTRMSCTQVAPVECPPP
jgi:hypothetical protein